MELNHEWPLVPKKSQPCLTKHWVSTSRTLAKTSLCCGDSSHESSERTRPLENPRGGETTAPRQERRSVGGVPETTEIGSGAKKGVRAGVQAKSPKVLTFRFFQCRSKVSACVGGRSAQNRSGTRPKGSQREAEHGAGGFQLPETLSMGEDVGSASLRAVSCSWKLSRDVRLDVELTALVSSVETTLCSNSIWSMLQRQLTECIMESRGYNTFPFARRLEDALRNCHAAQ